MATRLEYRVVYDARGFGQEIGTYELPLADSSSLEEAASRLSRADGYRSARIQSRTVTESDWEDVTDEA